MEEVKSGSRWSKPLAITAVVITIIACILAVAYNQTDLAKAAKSYEKNRDQAKAEGLFFTTADIEKLYTVPDSENGADLITPILTIPRKLKLDDPLKLTDKMIQDNWSEIQPALKSLEEASKRKYLIFKRDFQNPSATLYPQFADVKSWVKFLCGAAKLSERKNDPATAKRYFDLAAYLANSQDDEGILIGVLVRIACASIIEAELKKLIPIRGQEAAWQDVFESTVKRLDQPYDYRKVLALEHWFAVSSVDMLLKNPKAFYGEMGGGIANELKFGRYLPRFKEANLAQIHGAYAAAVHMYPQDPYDVKSIQGAYQELDRRASVHTLSNTLLEIMAPVFSQSTFAMAKEIGARNTLLQAIEMLKAKRNPQDGLPLKGRYELDNDGKKIRVKKLAKGWIVYSIGNDRTDDGGWDNMGQKGDWVVHLSKATVPPPIDPKKRSTVMSAPSSGIPAGAIPPGP